MIKKFSEWFEEKNTINEMDQDINQDINMKKMLGPGSALGSATQEVDPKIKAKLKSVLGELEDLYPNSTNALIEIIKAAMSELKDLGQSFGPGKALAAFDQPEIEPEIEPNIQPEILGDEE